MCSVCKKRYCHLRIAFDFRHALFNTEIPFMLGLLDPIAFARTSTDITKRLGEREQPSLTPLCCFKKLLNHPYVV